MTRDDYPSATDPVRIVTKKVYWEDIEPVRGTKSRAPIETILNTAQSRGKLGVRLRPATGGIGAPTWAKALANGPIPFIETQSGASVTIPDLWSPEYRTAVESLINWMATEFDNDARLLAVTAAADSTYYQEPFIKGLSNATNRQNILAAGYTEAEDRSNMKWQLDIMTAFTKTPIQLAYNPYQYITAGGGFADDLAFVYEVMDYHLALFGDRTILQNNSLRARYIDDLASPTNDTTRMIKNGFLPRVASPGTTQYQIAGANQVNQNTTLTVAQASADTMNWAIDTLNASGLELVNGWRTYHTNAQLSDWDTRLAAQVD